MAESNRSSSPQLSCDELFLSAAPPTCSPPITTPAVCARPASVPSVVVPVSICTVTGDLPAAEDAVLLCCQPVSATDQLGQGAVVSEGGGDGRSVETTLCSCCRQCVFPVASNGGDTTNRSGSDSGSRCGRLWRTLRSLRLSRSSRALSLTSQHALQPPSVQSPSCDESSNGARIPSFSPGRLECPFAHRNLVSATDVTPPSSRALQQQQRCGGGPTVHTTVDYVHRLVPALRLITDTSYYWGRIDRYQAERLLCDRPEGTFLLRDSAQEEHLFSVSFRRYERSLHARIEQNGAQFTFDAHDPGVFSSPCLAALIEHYKEPSCCMFFEPLLTRPLHRTHVFELQHLCRVVIVSLLAYDDIARLPLPRALRHFLMEYHYKQRVCVRQLELTD